MTLRGQKTQKNFSLDGHPVCCFFLFLAVNALLSYGSLPAGAKYGVGFLGLLVFALGLLRALKESAPGEKPPFDLELFPKLPGWGLPLLVVLAVFPRLFWLTGLSAWPFTDEGYFSYYSLELMKHWDWKFFFALGQHPPAFNWAFALFFKAFAPSLRTLWLFPALLSASAVWAALPGFKNRFPKSFVFFGLVFLGFGFWPLYAGRICQPTAAMLLAQVLALACLAAYARAGREKDRRKWSWACGAMTGLGFYASIAWPVVALSVLMVFLHRYWNRPEERGCFWRFLGSLLVTATPFLLESILQKNGRYINALWAFYPGMDWEQQCKDFFSHGQALLWGFNGRRLYGPVWGGLLNPVLGALFLTGSLELFRFRSRPFVRWIFLSLGLAFLPVALARGYDSFRIMMAFLPALVLIVSGLQAVLEKLKGDKRIGAAVLLLGISIGLDSYHLFNRFHHYWGTPGNAWNFGKEYELWKSYGILREMDSKMGPGAILFDLRAHVDDVTTEVAAYSFDTAMNPAFSFADSKWVAVLVDANYLPFLSKRFPEGRFYWLNPKRSYGRWALGVIPNLPSNRTVLEIWFNLNQALQAVTPELIDAMPGVSRKKMVDRILQCGGMAHGDPFLESCLWEKVFDNRAADHDASGCLEAARRCVLEGYPLPEMFNEQGVILVSMGRYQEARKAFVRAAKADSLHLTPSFENIQALNAAGK